jgi:hypothetical protein
VSLLKREASQLVGLIRAANRTAWIGVFGDAEFFGIVAKNQFVAQTLGLGLLSAERGAAEFSIAEDAAQR